MVESEVSEGLSASFAIPEWDPGWEYTGDPRHVRVLAGRLGGEPEYTCPQLQARKARPAIFPVRDRSSRFVERPAFADVPIGLARDVIIDLVEHRVTPTPDTIEQAAVRAAAPRELASSSSLVVQAAVMGYRQLLQNLRASGELASDAVLVTDLVVNDPHRDGGVTEWAAWALYWIARDGSRECHLLTWRDAGSRVRPESRLAVVARVTAEGFRASAPSSWSDRYQPETVQPPPVSAVRIREVGLLDSSCALLVDTDSAGARAMFDLAVAPSFRVAAALVAVFGSSARRCRGCPACWRWLVGRPMCGRCPPAICGSTRCVLNDCILRLTWVCLVSQFRSLKDWYVGYWCTRGLRRRTLAESPALMTICPTSLMSVTLGVNWSGRPPKRRWSLRIWRTILSNVLCTAMTSRSRVPNARLPSTTPTPT